MNKIIISILILVLPITLYSQKTKIKKIKYPNTKILKQEYQVLKKNNYVKHGYYKFFYKNGTAKQLGDYDRNKKIGVWKSYFENGTTEKIGTYDQNKMIGEWKEYNVQGKLKRIITYKNGRKITDKKVGIWYKYFERGKVRTGYDYDKNEKVETSIINIHADIRYPAMAREKEIEGVVKFN